MENKSIGYLIVGISVLMILIVLIFNNVMKEIIYNGCPYAKAGNECTSIKAIDTQTYFAFALVGILAIVGLVLIFSPQKEKIIVKKVRDIPRKLEIDVSDLKAEEKNVLRLIQEQRAMFQAELIEKTGFGKVKISRILDRLEGRGIIERKRRGMNNLVMVKELN